MQERLCEIAKENSQVYLILQDEDVRKFFKKLLLNYNSTAESVLFVKEKIK